jgi:hypothetical protein
MLTRQIPGGFFSFCGHVSKYYSLKFNGRTRVNICKLVVIYRMGFSFMRLIFRTFLIVACFGSAYANAETEVSPVDMAPANIPLLRIEDNMINLYGQYAFDKSTPSFISPSLGKRIDPDFIFEAERPNYASDDPYSIPEDQLPQFRDVPVNEPAKSELLKAMEYKTTDQIFMAFKREKPNVEIIQQELKKATLTVNLGYTISSVEIVPPNKDPKDTGYAWIGGTSPFKKDAVIKKLVLTEQKAKTNKIAALSKKYVAEILEFINTQAKQETETPPKTSCVVVPEKTATYGGVEFILLRATCKIGTDNKEFDTLTLVDGEQVITLGLELDKDSIEVFDILNDYSMLLEDPNQRIGECHKVYLRDKRGVWKVASPSCRPRGC